MKTWKLLAALWIYGVFAIPCHGAGKSRFITRLEAGKPQVVVTYGTSLTAAGAWVRQMTDVLDKQYPKLATVINSGGSGKWSQWGVENLEKRVLEKKPDTVFIEFSMNDSAAIFHVSIETAKTNLENMIDRIKKANPECEIILMTMTPGNKHPKGHKSHRENIEGHYAMYRTVAAEHRLLLIDHYPNWIKLQKENPALFDQYVPDSVHPTPEGCAKVITPVIFDAVGIVTKDPIPFAPEKPQAPETPPAKGH